jgi:hypothetical protein
MLVKKGYYEKWLGDLSLAKVAEAVADYEFTCETGIDAENAIRECLGKVTEEDILVESGDWSDEFHIAAQGAESRGMVIYTENISGGYMVKVKSIVRYTVENDELVACEDGFLKR